MIPFVTYSNLPGLSNLPWPTTLSTYHAFLPAFLLQVPATEKILAFLATTGFIQSWHQCIHSWSYSIIAAHPLDPFASSCINITRHHSHHVGCNRSERGCPVCYLPIQSRFTQDLSFKNSFQLSAVFTFVFLVPNPFSSQLKPAINLLPASIF